MTQYSTPPQATLASVTVSKIDAVLSNSSLVLLILLGLGIISAILGLLAYAPADGADGMDYYLHAAYLAGAEISVDLALHPPLLPILIALFQYGLGQIYGLIVLQAVLAAFEGLLFYWALREYDARLAFIVACAVACDMQVKVLSSFVSTEPLYIFLCSVAFCLLMLQIRHRNNDWKQPRDWLLGITLALLFFTRTVGRYLILPFGFPFLLFTRSWKRSLLLLIVYWMSLQAFSFVYGSVTNIRANVAGLNNAPQLAIPLFRGNFLQAENGAASAELLELASHCLEEVPIRCMIELHGDRTYVLALINRALREAVIAQPIDYGIAVLRHLSQFLSLSGQQYRDVSPAQQQCEDTEVRKARMLASFLYGDEAWLMAQSAPMDISKFELLLDTLVKKMCPPLPDFAPIRSFVDSIAAVYNMVGLRWLWLWYLLLLGLTWKFLKREYMAIVFSAMLIVFYHAGISAIIFNVQTRYVVVTNPYRIVLLIMMVYVVIHLLPFVRNRFQAKIVSN